MQIPYANLAIHADTTVDANGWKKINLGAVTIYQKKWTGSASIGANTAAALLSSQALPVGISTIGTPDGHSFSYIVGGSGSAALFIKPIPAGDVLTGTTMNIYTQNVSGGTVNYIYSLTMTFWVYN